MPGPATEPPPSAWEVANDYSKTVITLASGFLALTVTFATQLVSKETPLYEKALLVGTWAALILTVAFSVVTVMLLINYLQHGTRSRGSILFANLSFISLGIAGLCFLIFGSSAFVFNTRAWDAPTAVEKTIAKMPMLAAMPDSKWTLKSLKYDASKKTYHLEVLDEKSGTRCLVMVDAARNGYDGVEKFPKEVPPPPVQEKH